VIFGTIPDTPSVVARIALWSVLTDGVKTLTWYCWGTEVIIMSRIFAPLVGEFTNGSRPVLSHVGLKFKAMPHVGIGL